MNIYRWVGGVILVLATMTSVSAHGSLITFFVADEVTSCPFAPGSPCGESMDRPGPVSVGTIIRSNIKVDRKGELKEYSFVLPEVGITQPLDVVVSRSTLQIVKGTLRGILIGQFAIGPPGPQVPMAVIQHDFNAGKWALSLFGNTINSGTSTVARVPEPGVYSLFGVGLFVLMLLQRRRRSV